jgi:hypothetical protein
MSNKDFAGCKLEPVKPFGREKISHKSGGENPLSVNEFIRKRQHFVHLLVKALDALVSRSGMLSGTDATGAPSESSRDEAIYPDKIFGSVNRKRTILGMTHSDFRLKPANDVTALSVSICYLYFSIAKYLFASPPMTAKDLKQKLDCIYVKYFVHLQTSLAQNLPKRS